MKTYHYYILYETIYTVIEYTNTIGLFRTEQKAQDYIDAQEKCHNVKYSIEGIDIIE